ncbi:MAG TPA: HAD family phosphatase [Candidatus Thermoplasmatota archaeon]|jgi:HAD superfamily hydrolase (TIGR01509 family)|nr:HAD family phosphatase [Candidatus Thermoplasmatota archaeon]
MPSAFGAAIFDLDGVLADSMRQHHMAYVHALQGLGDVPRSEVYAREGMNARHVAAEILAMQGRPVEEAEARKLGDAKQAAFRAMGRPPLYRGAEQCIGALQSAGVLLAVVTGTSRENAHFILGPLTQHFGHIVADGDYAQSKPHPEPYLSAAVKLGVEPSRCVAIENAVLGVRSAVAAGMTCIALPTTMPVETLRAAGAHAIAGSLRDVAGLVLGGLKKGVPPEAAGN